MRADLALIGYGNVGKRFARLLDEQRDYLDKHCGLDCRVIATATRRHGSEADGRPCADAFEAIRHLGKSDADLRVMVETTTLDIERGEPAISHVRAAFDAGCHVITATPSILSKLDVVGTDLLEYSLDTVRMFHRDAEAAGYKIAIASGKGTG